MATSLYVEIGGTDVSSRVTDVEIKPTNVAQGHSSFVIYLENSDGTYTGSFDVQDEVLIRINDITIMKGYVDLIEHIIEDDVDIWRDTLRISGRDYSQDLSNLEVTHLWSSATDSYDIIDEALSEAGAEITYTPSTASSSIGPYLARDEKLLKLVTNVCERANLEGYVNLLKDLQIYPIGNRDSGVTLKSVEGATDNNILGSIRYTEKDGLELANYIYVYGDDSLAYPSDNDDFTEPEDVIDTTTYSTTSTAYVLTSTFTLTPASGKRIQLLRVQAEYWLDTDATEEGRYKITYQLGSGTETNIVDEESVSSTSADTYQHITNVVGDPDQTVTIRFYIRAVTSVTIYQDNAKVYYMESEALLTDSGNVDADTSNFVAGSGSLVHSLTTSTQFIRWRFPSAIDCLSRKAYKSLHFYIKLSSSAGSLEYLEVRLDNGAGDYFYKRFYGLQEDEWIEMNIPLGPTLSEPWLMNGSLQWDNIWELEIRRVHSTSADLTMNIDNLYFSEGAVVGSDINTASETSYRKRVKKVMDRKKDEEEVQALAESLEEKYSNPLELISFIAKGTSADHIVSLTQDASSGSTSISVSDVSHFHVGEAIDLRDDNNREINQIASINTATNVLGLVNATSNSYTVANNAKVKQTKWLPGYVFTLNIPKLNISNESWRVVDILLRCSPYKDLYHGHDYIAEVKLVPSSTKIEVDRLESIIGAGETTPFIKELDRELDRRFWR